MVRIARALWAFRSDGHWSSPRQESRSFATSSRALVSPCSLKEKCLEFDVATLTARRGIGQMPHENVATFGITDQQPSVAVRTGMNWNRWIFQLQSSHALRSAYRSSELTCILHIEVGKFQTETLPFRGRVVAIVNHFLGFFPDRNPHDADGIADHVSAGRFWPLGQVRNVAALSRSHSSVDVPSEAPTPRPGHCLDRSRGRYGQLLSGNPITLVAPDFRHQACPSNLASTFAADRAANLTCVAASLAWVVRLVDISHCKRTLAMNLDDRVACRPCVVVHVRGRDAKSTSGQVNALCLVEFVSHSDVKVARDHGHIFRRRVIVGRNLIVCRYV